MTPQTDSMPCTQAVCIHIHLEPPSPHHVQAATIIMELDKETAWFPNTVQLPPLLAGVNYSYACVSSIAGWQAHQGGGPPAPGPLRGQSGHRFWRVPGPPWWILIARSCWAWCSSSGLLLIMSHYNIVYAASFNVSLKIYIHHESFRASV